MMRALQLDFLHPAGPRLQLGIAVLALGVAAAGFVAWRYYALSGDAERLVDVDGRRCALPGLHRGQRQLRAQATLEVIAQLAAVPRPGVRGQLGQELRRPDGQLGARLQRDVELGAGQCAHHEDRDLRSDPFETADHESMDYERWRVEHLFVMVPAQQYVGRFLGTFREFPPSQKPGSFSIDGALEALQRGAQGGSK